MSAVEPAVGEALPGEPCRVPPYESWTDLEKWVWQEIGSGRTAKINAHLGKAADPSKPDEWGPERRLSSAFLETVLLHDPWRSAIPRQGVQIIGALFDEHVELKWADLPTQLALCSSRLNKNVSLSGIRAQSISLEKSTIYGSLDLPNAHVKGDLLIQNAAVHSSVQLRAAIIDGHFIFDSTTIFGSLHVELTQIIGSFLCRKFTCNENVEMEAIMVGGQLDMSDIKMTKKINMRGAKIGGTVSCDRGTFADADFNGAHIEGQLVLDEVTVAKNLKLDGMVIGRDAFLRLLNVTGGPLHMIFASIEGNLDMRGAKLCEFDLTGTRIGKEFTLSGEGYNTTWLSKARLVLVNTSVPVIQDHPHAWPGGINLEGFTYNRFGGFRPDPNAAITKRGSTWFKGWLARDNPYTPQPYQQCAKVLREMGHPEMADDVLYAGRERERQAALRNGNNPRATGLLLLKLFVGYGHGRRMLWHPLGWVLGLTVAGTAILQLTGVPKGPGGSVVTPWFFSFDLLLPIIQLYEPHYKVVLDGVAKYYFAFHKLMGYVLASFLIAGLAGLTK